VALEREDIVRTDFPVERRGYAPEVVDRHLERVASEAEALRRESEKKETSLAGTAGQRVQAIVDAAESTAAEIERDAREEAARIRDDASREAKQRAGEVRAAADELRSRIEKLQGEIGSIFDDLRSNAGQLIESIGSLERQAAQVGVPGGEETSNGPAAAVADTGSEELEVETVIAAEAEAPAAVEEGDEASEDAQNARLVALNMALNGASRNETERYLAENFTIGDATELLDDVYAQRGT
jgi:cell division septum initiation protein DivIVA